jgi:hypothetical protein
VFSGGCNQRFIRAAREHGVLIPIGHTSNLEVGIRPIASRCPICPNKGVPTVQVSSSQSQLDTPWSLGQD